ncbi:MAG: metalloproteinase, extracellular matrix glycoprotein VMP23 [Parcubacteria group bacterium Gr01-1014_72]|nr:MAG: metalloproteinase, extracellular matrix glycoprotein VMP23 [Parcubacteria group bacterium Gr01-1014_72]
MNYFDEFKKIRAAVKGKTDKDYISLCDDVGAVFDLTLDEIGALYSLASNLLAGKQPTRGETITLLEKELGDEQRARAGEIADLFIKNIVGSSGNVPVTTSAAVGVRTLPVPSPRPTAIFPNMGTLTPSKQKNLITPSGAPTPRVPQGISVPRPPLPPPRPMAEPLLPPLSRPTTESPKPKPSEILEGSVIAKLIDIAKGTGYTKERIEVAYAKVPASVKQAVTSVDVAQKLQEIGQTFGLHIDQIGAVASESGLLMVGLTHPGDFIGHLETRLRTSREKATLIGKAVNEGVFREIRDALHEIHEERAAVEAGIMVEKESAGPAVPTPEESALRRDEVLRDIEVPPVTSLSRMNTLAPSPVPPRPPLPAALYVPTKPQPPANLPIGTPPARFESRPKEPPQAPLMPPVSPRPPRPAAETLRPAPPQEIRTISTETASGNLVAEKLSGIVRGTSNRITVPPPPPKRYEQDPYREAV